MMMMMMMIMMVVIVFNLAAWNRLLCDIQTMYYIEKQICCIFLHDVQVLDIVQCPGTNCLRVTVACKCCIIFIIVIIIIIKCFSYRANMSA